MNQHVIRVHSEPGRLSNNINELLELTDLGNYGLPKQAVAFIEQIAPIHATLAFVLVRLMPAATPAKTSKKGKAKP